MRALDLFCCGGGASMGIHRAGFHLVGVDKTFRDCYPFNKIVGDVFDILRWLDTDGFSFIWASPPCQAFSRVTPKAARARHVDLIDQTRQALTELAKNRPAENPLMWCIENVPDAPLRPDVILTGDMFGLNTYRRRHFETNFLCFAPCPPGPRFGPESRPGAVTVAGGGGGKAGTKEQWEAAMGIDWMGRRELAQAIPPVYAEHIARQAKKAIDGRARIAAGGAETRLDETTRPHSGRIGPDCGQVAGQALSGLVGAP